MAGEQRVDEALGRVRAFVAEALALRLRGRSDNYHLIISQLSLREDADALNRILVALSSCVTTLTAHPDKFDGLFQALYKLEWPADERLANALTGLVTLLVSVNSTFLHPTLKMLARGLSLKPLALAGVAAAAASPDPRHSSIHKALRLSLALVPSGQCELFPHLRDAFPHRRNDGPTLVSFARQLLATVEYVPSLRERVLSLLIERCLEIDVEIKIEDSGEACYHQCEDGEALVLSETAHHVDLFDLHGHHDPTAPPAAADDADDCNDKHNKQPAPAVDEMAEKLDGLMLLLFQHLEQQARGPVGPEEEEEAVAPRALVLLEALLPTLEASILPTHRCKYVQFLLFFLTTPTTPSSSPSLVAQRLLSHLCGLMRSESVPTVLRQNAASYVASFLARSRALPVPQVRAVLLDLLRDAEAYVTQQLVRQEQQRRWSRGYYYDEDEEEEEEERAAGAVVVAASRGASMGGAPPVSRASEEEQHQHLVFYSICQAVLYVVAFHHSTVGGEDLLGLLQPPSSTTHNNDQGQQRQTDDDDPSVQELRWRLANVVHCHLRPLTRCLDSVRREFLRLAFRHDLLQPYVLAELGGGPCPHHRQQQHAAAATDEAPSSSWSSCQACCLAPPSGGGGGSSHHNNPLESFFPFDPYCLRRSSRFVASPDVYRYWQATQDFTDDHCDEDEALSDASLRSVDGSASSSSSEDEDEEDDDDDEEEAGQAMSLDSRYKGQHGLGGRLMIKAAGERRRAAAAGGLRASSAGMMMLVSSSLPSTPRSRVESVDLTNEDDHDDHHHLLRLATPPRTTTTRHSSKHRGRRQPHAEELEGSSGSTSGDDEEEEEEEDLGYDAEEEQEERGAGEAADEEKEEDEELALTERRARALSVDSVGSW